MKHQYSFDPSLSDNIPARLKNIDQWLVWNSIPRTGLTNKFNKVSYNFRTGKPSDPTSTDTSLFILWQIKLIFRFFFS